MIVSRQSTEGVAGATGLMINFASRALLVFAAERLT